MTTKWGVFALIIAGCMTAGTVHQSAADGLQLTPPIAQRFLERTDLPLVSYRARRQLTASNERLHVSGWVTALTELEPEGRFRYSIVAEGGSDYIRNKVLRKILDREQRALQSDERARAELSLENYRFGEPVVDDDGLMLVPIAPRRHADLLVKGRIALTPDGDLVRIEGHLEKNPSFWTRRVDLVRRYGRLNGVRVPLQLSSTAHVLVVGLSTFSICFDYELVNGSSVPASMSCSQVDNRLEAGYSVQPAKPTTAR